MTVVDVVNVDVADVVESTALGDLAQFEPAPDAVPLEAAKNAALDDGEPLAAERGYAWAATELTSLAAMF
jgi:hypothetical protein